MPGNNWYDARGFPILVPSAAQRPDYVLYPPLRGYQEETVKFMSVGQKSKMNRRTMLGQCAAASALGAIFKMIEAPAAAQQGRGGGGFGRGGVPIHYGPINKYSAPSDLRITDMRVVTVASNFDYTIVRLDTNQDVYGLGEIRDGANRQTVLNFKNQLVGRNPLDITGILGSIRAGAGHGRTGGAGYSGIDIALHDIVGKVFGVPVWRLFGRQEARQLPRLL